MSSRRHGEARCYFNLGRGFSQIHAEDYVIIDLSIQSVYILVKD